MHKIIVISVLKRVKGSITFHQDLLEFNGLINMAKAISKTNNISVYSQGRITRTLSMGESIVRHWK